MFIIVKFSFLSSILNLSCSNSRSALCYSTQHSSLAFLFTVSLFHAWNYYYTLFLSSLLIFNLDKPNFNFLTHRYHFSDLCVIVRHTGSVYTTMQEKASGPLAWRVFDSRVEHSQPKCSPHGGGTPCTARGHTGPSWHVEKPWHSESTL